MSWALTTHALAAIARAPKQGVPGMFQHVNSVEQASLEISESHERRRVWGRRRSVAEIDLKDQTRYDYANVSSSASRSAPKCPKVGGREEMETGVGLAAYDARTSMERRRRISDLIPKAEADEGQRENKRIPLDADVTFIHPAEISGVALDASEGGLRVVTQEPLHPGTRCIAVVQLPSGDETHERMEVVWTKRTEQGWVAGLSFST